ncbi:MAG TPA: response regulator [Stellaceae bacterium]|nr:response regulator [Stellaceae bacterium]
MRGIGELGQDGWAAGEATVAADGSREADAAPVEAALLVVDDKPKNLAVVASMLEGLSERIIQATSAKDALRYLLHHDVALVLLDVQMPDVDGYELAALIRQRERSRYTPIIFVTAYDRDEHEVARGYALGAVDYVFKPINPTVLRAKVSVFVDLFKKTEAVRQQAAHERKLYWENLRTRADKLQTERALRQIEGMQSVIIRSLPIALYTADVKGRFSGARFLSERMASSVGFKRSAFVDDEDLWTARIHPADLPRVLSQVAAIAETGTLSTEYRWRCADNAERVFLDQAVLVRDDVGGPKEILGTCLDITDRRQLEQQLLQSQKLDAIGRLTGGIAHDFNNMLSVIIWNLDALARSIKANAKDRERVANALGAALNCADLVRQLLTFARHQPHQPKVIDVAEMISRMSRLLGPVLGEQVRIEARPGQDIWPIFADPAQIESALVNLAINARDAMPDGGTLTIEGANLHQDKVDAEPPQGDYVLMTVGDTGVGMAQDVMDRAFEPFFTTKPPGEGSGLGLSMVHGFVKQAGGHVAIDSAVGGGTRIRLYLPRTTVDRAIDDRSSVDAGGIESSRSHAVLVVEDNAIVRGVAVARFKELGHRVLEAESAVAALEILTGSDPIDLLFTDVVIPGAMGGLDLARRALELRPGIRVIFTSGYAASFNSVADLPGEFLQKPYRDEDLQRALSRVLGSAGAVTPSARDPIPVPSA